MIGRLAVSVIKCLDDPVQPHQNAKDDVLVLARARGHVRENGHTNFLRACLRYPNPIIF